MSEVVQQRFGRTFHEFTVGTTYRHWPGRTITEYDNLSFSLLTQNQHPLHIDSAFGAETSFGKPLVVGTLVLAVIVGQSVADISGQAIANLGYDKIRHVGPTYHGDTLYSETIVLDKRVSDRNSEQGIVHVRTRGFNQRSEDVITFERHVLVPVGGETEGGT
jgi:acyl dehydratase